MAIVLQFFRLNCDLLWSDCIWNSYENKFKNETSWKKISRGKFFRKEMDSVADILVENIVFSFSAIHNRIYGKFFQTTTLPGKNTKYVFRQCKTNF